METHEHPFQDGSDETPRLLNEISEEQARLNTILEELELNQGEDFKTLKDELLIGLSEASKEHQGAFPLLTALVLLLAITASFYSLAQSYSLHEKWQSELSKKMEEARELDSVIRFLKKQIELEKTNAGQSHQSTDS